MTNTIILPRSVVQGALEALTKRLALDLECVLLNRDKWWDQAHATLQDYRDLMGQWYPQETVSPLGKD